MAELERKQKGCKTKNRVWFATILALLGIVAGGSYVYAKYFSESARWGIAIASGVYFTANYAADVTNTNADVEDNGDVGTDTDTGINNKDYFESVVNSSYAGSNYEFVFEVRNYENNLLFNESGVVIPYTVTFWLGEAPTNATYTVKWQQNEQECKNEITAENKITISNQSIGGGSAYANEYKIGITVENTEVKHASVPIYVEVKTEDGAMINKTLGGKMILTNVELPKSYIESQGFVTPEEYTDDAEKFARLQKMAIFTYEVRTVGEVETDDVTEKLRLVWDPNLLEIDLFDEIYLEWQKTEAASNNGTIPSGPYQYTIDGKTYYYITFEVMPYSSQTINFLRGEQFATIEAIAEDDSGSAAMKALEAAVWAEKYTE